MTTQKQKVQVQIEPRGGALRLCSERRYLSGVAEWTSNPGDAEEGVEEGK